MIENIKVFEQMMELNSKHVIKMLEYVIGRLGWMVFDAYDM